MVRSSFVYFPQLKWLYERQLQNSGWSFIEKTSVKQDPKPQVCSNFQVSFLHLSQMDPQ